MHQRPRKPPPPKAPSVRKIVTSSRRNYKIGFTETFFAGMATGVMAILMLIGIIKNL